MWNFPALAFVHSVNFWHFLGGFRLSEGASTLDSSIWEKHYPWKQPHGKQPHDLFPDLDFVEVDDCGALKVLKKTREFSPLVELFDRF